MTSNGVTSAGFSASGASARESDVLYLIDRLLTNFANQPGILIPVRRLLQTDHGSEDVCQAVNTDRRLHIG